MSSLRARSSGDEGAGTGDQSQGPVFFNCHIGRVYYTYNQGTAGSGPSRRIGVVAAENISDSETPSPTSVAGTSGSSSRFCARHTHGVYRRAGRQSSLWTNTSSSPRMARTFMRLRRPTLLFPDYSDHAWHMPRRRRAASSRPVSPRQTEILSSSDSEDYSVSDLDSNSDPSGSVPPWVLRTIQELTSDLDLDQSRLDFDRLRLDDLKQEIDWIISLDMMARHGNRPVVRDGGVNGVAAGSEPRRQVNGVNGKDGGADTGVSADASSCCPGRVSQATTVVATGEKEASVPGIGRVGAARQVPAADSGYEAGSEAGRASLGPVTPAEGNEAEVNGVGPGVETVQLGDE
ncbi:uncharacterized protein THITE_152296 [Thermothielavioides terrestris NRRL 8126]|uniref:Uncharacterized protein n=1 Tax=Thermothielavioides terrestris (strain ATCC 38088 / NRRL 8126) TaxID=578455 RepID=G2QYB0_THETT|nr:uncharacterized protein THITE_152296 [Thermothielavioides terrestris NRRL 8126]AEO66208.1 hypothetical protein THITE_152296 [Thermothielavioides terrestris NRRL 8126]